MSPVFESEGPQSPLALRDNLRAELDKIALRLQDLPAMDLAEVLLYLASSSARLGEIRLQLIRSDLRWAQSLRTKEIDPLMDLLKFQFQIYSRITAIRQQELDLLRGQR
jgi:hypothetical protein